MFCCLSYFVYTLLWAENCVVQVLASNVYLPLVTKLGSWSVASASTVLSSPRCCLPRDNWIDIKIMCWRSPYCFGGLSLVQNDYHLSKLHSVPFICALEILPFSFHFISCCDACHHDSMCSGNGMLQCCVYHHRWCPASKTLWFYGCNSALANIQSVLHIRDVWWVGSNSTGND